VRKDLLKKFIYLLTAAAVCTALLTGCVEGNAADWEDTLPSAETESSRPTAVYLTEETTESSPPVTFPDTESTKRTAFSEPGPELATTTATESETSASTDISTVPGIPNVPISEFTSTTPVNLATSPTVQSESAPLSDSPASVTTAPAAAETRATATSETTGSLDTITSTVGTPSASDLERPYSYRFLNDNQTYIYDEIIKAAEQYGGTITFSKDVDITSEDYCDVYQIIYDEEPSLFYLDKKMQYAVNSSTKKLASSKLMYKYENSVIYKMQSEIDTEVNKILSMIEPDMTEYDKVKLFNDVLASTVVYDESAPNCRDIYGVFVGKKAICGGYSKAFSYLCSKAGIETAAVTGDADGLPHMWNKVKVDGKWYNIDVTYAVSGDGADDYIRYDYFCVPDKMLEESRTVYEQSYKYPEANSDGGSYFAKNSLVADSWDEAKIILRDELIRCSEEKEFPVQVKCSSKKVYEETTFNLFDSSTKYALDVYEEAYEPSVNKYNTSVVNFSYDETSLVIKLFPEYE
jgi:transglutaminase/protease-like cytokinesis protein 3